MNPTHLQGGEMRVLQQIDSGGGEWKAGTQNIVERRVCVSVAKREAQGEMKQNIKWLW